MKIWPVFIALMLLVVGCGPYDPKSQEDLGACYKNEFDALPPSSVSSLQARQMVIRDWGAQWLQFNADKATIDALLQKGFERISKEQFMGKTVSKYTPQWWPSKNNNLTAFYYHPSWKRRFVGSNVAYLAHDEAHKRVCFMSEGIE